MALTLLTSHTRTFITTLFILFAATPPPPSPSFSLSLSTTLTMTKAKIAVVYYSTWGHSQHPHSSHPPIPP